MFNKSSLAGNQSVFVDLNRVQIGIEKDNNQVNNWLTIWWDNEKIEVGMLKIQTNGIQMDQAYNWY